MRKITFGKMVEAMCKARENGKEMSAVIVYAQSNFTEQYTLDSLSYKVSNWCNYFDSSKISRALWGHKSRRHRRQRET